MADKEEYQNQPAFPTIGDVTHNPQWLTEHGMTLLDYFAAKAMGTLCNSLNVHQISDMERKGIAEKSYSVAAAMMEERKKYLVK